VKDDELRRRVRHAAEVHGVPASEVVDEVLGEDEPEEEPKKRRHPVGLLVTLVMSCVVFGVGIWWLLKVMDEPAVAGQLMREKIEASASPTPMRPQTFQGLYITFDYPKLFDALGRKANDKKSLEQYTIGSKKDHRWTMQVNVRPLPQGGLYNDAGYRGRTLKPDEYKAEPVKIGGQPGAILMVATKGDERTLYWPMKDKMVTISLSFTGGTKELVSYMQLVMDTLRPVTQ
jgi:hypothetical protein